MSGGRTSAYMTEKVLKIWSEGHLSDVEFVITFANTGREHEETLRFVDKCDKRWQKLYGVSVIWLEAMVHNSRTPCSHKVVSFKDASRHGEPFEEVVKKYGLPNSQFLHCTRELKENPILSYLESIGQRKGHIAQGELVRATYETWIGIRGDERSRLRGERDGKQFKVYPLAGDDIGADSNCEDSNLSCDKTDVLDFWEDMPFDLNIPEHLGNCIDCHKKSFNKLFKCIRDLGEAAFDFTSNLDKKYSMVKAQNVDGRIIPRKRFRDYNDTSELIAMFKQTEFNPKSYDNESGGCSESCEPFMDENAPVNQAEGERHA